MILTTIDPMTKVISRITNNNTQVPMNQTEKRPGKKQKRPWWWPSDKPLSPSLVTSTGNELDQEKGLTSKLFLIFFILLIIFLLPFLTQFLYFK